MSKKTTLEDLEADRRTGRTTAMLRDALRLLRAEDGPRQVVVVMLFCQDIDYAKTVLARDLLATKREINEIRWTTKDQSEQFMRGRLAHVFYDHAIGDVAMMRLLRARAAR